MSYYFFFVDDLFNYIIFGRVLIKLNIGEFIEILVIFEDGIEEDFDVVIFVIGYIFYFFFLGNDLIVLDS